MNTSFWQTPWKTEGQWASGLSGIAAEHLTKQAAITAAQGAFVGKGENTGNTLVRSPPDTGGQALDAVQTDDVGRFDVYNDGYTEATAWPAPSEAILELGWAATTTARWSRQACNIAVCEQTGPYALGVNQQGASEVGE